MARRAPAEQTEHFFKGLSLTFWIASKRWPLVHSYS